MTCMQMTPNTLVCAHTVTHTHQSLAQTTTQLVHKMQIHTDTNRGNPLLSSETHTAYLTAAV